MLPELVKGFVRSLQDFFVKQPFLEPETFGATFQILSFLEDEFLKGDAAGAGAVFVEGHSTLFPFMPHGEAAQAMNAGPKRVCCFGEESRGR
jgi:hypothetical protein